MNNPGHNERLLADVLGEGVAADFRDGLLNETLCLARRRRRVRLVRAALPALAVLLALGFLVWHQAPFGQRPTTLQAKPYSIVRTRPLPPAAWVVTMPLSPARLVASVPTDSVVLTAHAGARAREINDDELLALVPKPAALVRCGPHCAELVFVSQEDRDELLRN
ncbi:MAG TPA: hypothetical protein P5205_07195 [Candidatus Paceibacterota bacterium]|nr:hypothetical protein [Verrucomicrobiota bacterium]HSA10143.1 hypothetical protein [Candidatus Paceibacterota bacterium]